MVCVDNRRSHSGASSLPSSTLAPRLPGKRVHLQSHCAGLRYLTCVWILTCFSSICCEAWTSTLGSNFYALVDTPCGSRPICSMPQISMFPLQVSCHQQLWFHSNPGDLTAFFYSWLHSLGLAFYVNSRICLSVRRKPLRGLSMNYLKPRDYELEEEAQW